MSTPPLNTTAGVALELLRSIAKSTEVFPPLQSVAELALHITEIVKEFHVSKNEWIELGIYVRDATANVTQSVAQVGAFHEDTKKNLEKLQSTLREIARTVEAEQKSPWHKRIGGLMKRPEIIESMRKRIDDAIGLFQLSATVMTMMDLKTTVDAVIANGKTLSGIVDKAASISRKASHIDLNATLSKLQRVKGSSWDPSRACMKDTRVELIKRVVAWLNSPTKSGGAEIMLMTAVAGAGKTTVAHTVARECHERKQLGSSFFFDRETEGRNSPVALITTIVADLSRLSQGLGNRITTAIEQDPSLPSAPLSRQFEELLLKPCIECPIAGPIVIVIDALDEAWSNDMLDILCNGVPQLPQTFRIFLTSRMRSEFDGLLRRTHVVGEELNIGAQSNMNDIEVYVPSMLRKLADDRRLGSDWPGEELQRQFTAKSDGLFLWVATVCSYLLHREDPTEELRELISMTGLSGSTAGDHMNRLYARILESFDWTDTRFVATYRRVMGTAIATKTPLTIHAMKQLYHGKPLASDFTLQKLNPLLTGMRAADHETQPVRVLHQSLRDFLVVQATSSSTETGYKIVEQEWSQELALLCLELLNRDLKPDTPGTGFLTEGEESAAGVPACDVIPEALRYACLHWQNHLCDAKLSKQVEDALTQFMGHRLVQWMEVSAVCGRYGGISQAQHWMQVTGSTSCTQLSQLYNQVYARASSLLGSRLRYDDRREEALISGEEAVKVYERLSADEPAAFTPTLADSLNNLSIHLSDLGRREEALATIEEATQLIRQLAADRPAAFTPVLANSLNNLSLCLSDLGRREDALATVEEATQLRRQLAADRPAAFTPVLAASLNILSNRLSDLGRREDALATIKEATQLYRQLAADRPAAFTPVLADSLNNLSNRLSDLGRREEALSTIEEATQLYRQLAADRPATFTPTLADSLNNLSIRLSDLGRREEALATIEEATQLYRQLAADRPAAFTPVLADSLNNLSNRLSDLGRREDALATIEEATQLRRQLAADRPAAFTPVLADSLNNLSNRLSDLGRREEALATIEEATQLYRQLAADRPAAFTPDLAMSLNNLSNRLSDLGRREEALATIEEATQLYRQLAADRPAVFTPVLAHSLNNLSVRLSDLGRREEALATIEEATQLYRQLAADRPAAFTPDLAMSLNNLSIYLSNMGRPEGALVANKEAVQLYRQLSADRPAVYTSELANSLNSLSDCLSGLGHLDDALGAIEESLDLRRQLYAERPATFMPDLSKSLNSFSDRLCQLDRHGEALAAIEEALRLRRQLATERSAVFAPELSESLHTCSLCLSSLGRRQDALTAIEEAVEIRRQLVATRPLAFTAKLKQSLLTISDLLASMGRDADAQVALTEANGLSG